MVTAFVADFNVAKPGALHSPKLSTAELLYGAATRLGLQPVWITPDGVFAVTINWREMYINFARSPLNSDNSVSLAKDKYIARLILERHGITNIPFARPQSYAQAETFLARHGAIIAKPVAGSGASDIHHVTQASQLEGLNVQNYILEKYIAGQEMRYLVLDGSVIGMYHSEYGVSVASDRPLQCISYPEDAWDDALVALSSQIARALDLTFAAVDYLVDDDGHAHVLEVNTMPDLKWFHSPTSGPAVDAAGRFMHAILAANQPVMPEHLLTAKVRSS